ncbi:MAG: hypothetical protein ACRD0I_05120 [Acidimicrobiales bacterium]
MPAAVLILVILAALALDSALVYLGQRQLSDAAASAAADAAGSISDAAFYQHGLVILNPAQAVQVAMASIGAQQFSQVRLSGSPDIEVVGNQVCVALTGSVTHIFGLAIPGIDHITTVMARATATAAGASGPVVKHRRVC